MFSKDFVWGIASSSIQIEGKEASLGDGRTVWDEFIAAGKVANHDTADVSCDHIHRYKEDIKLMRLMGVKAYRFSINWARIIPEGTGRVNEKSIEWYRDMVQELIKNGITPYITLYHWELPQALQEQGGWLNEATIDAFGEYAGVVAERFSDLCEYFITLNEPQCFVGLGYLRGVHAPGLQLSYEESFQIAHNALKAHGKAVIAIREHAVRPVKVGYAPTCGMAYPASDREEDIEAASTTLFTQWMPMENWTWNVAWFLDPVVLGHYPEDGLEKFKQYLPEITEEDMKLICQPLDFLGQNIYNGYMVKAGADGKPEPVARASGYSKTAAGWPVTPQAFYWGLRFLYERYKLPLYVTENGMSCHDAVSADGQVHDPNRIGFLDSYLSEMQRAVDDGVDIRGYFLWTFLDNFEWDKGYNERFGIIYVDFDTQERIIKDSAYWYKKVMDTNGATLSINTKPRQILFVEPVLHNTPWGGTRLKDEWGYDTEQERIGECWGICAHQHGDCVVKSGSYFDVYQGRTLSDLWENDRELFGNLEGDRFPLMVKLLDAETQLSIQVHPNDAYAKANEADPCGKAECWYILDCPEDAKLVVGHNAATREDMEQMIAEGKWDDFIRELPVKKGDFVQIDPGTIHAITPGMLIIETQQNADTTYRVYDYDRLVNGKKRELHVEKCLDVTTFPAKPSESTVYDTTGFEKDTWNTLYQCKQYQVFMLDMTGEFSFEQEYPFLNVSVVEGEGTVNGRVIKRGDHFIIPSEFGTVRFQGTMKLIASTRGIES